MYPRVNLFGHNLCVEVSLFFFMFAYNLMDTVDTNMYLQKACRPNATAEPDLSSPCDEKLGISYVATVNSTYRFGMFFAAILLTIFVSSWSDSAGKNRKQVMLYIYCGHLIQLVCQCVQAYFWRWPPIYAVLTEILGQTIFLGNIGYRAFSTLIMCDMTGHQERTTRLMALQAIDFSTIPISAAISGFLIRRLGFLKTYGICVAVSVVGLVFAFFMTDVSKEQPEKASIWSVISLRRVVASFKLVFAKKTLKQRMLMPVLFLITLIGYFTYKGELTVLYLYLRYRFQWHEEQYGVYVSYKLSGSIIGMLITSVILSKLLKLHDAVIGIMAAFWDTMAVVAYLFATENWQLYFIPLLDIFHGVALSIGQSFASKLFDSDELGQFFSVSLVFCLAVPFGVPAYNTLFDYTKDTYPASLFLLSIPLDITICLLYGISYIMIRE